MSEAPLNRSELAENVAITRAKYEIETLAAGYTERHFQDMLPFVRSEAIALAKRRPVQGIRVVVGEYSTSVYPRVDFKKLAVAVERQVPRWREAIIRNREERARA